MTTRPLLIVGVLVNSALYLSAVVGTAVWERNWLASRLGITAIGLTYLAYNQMFAFPDWPRTIAIFSLGSIAVGVLAGLALL